ncbi:imidazolonepropionase [Anopheles sinensis]|uniref:Imidazolonepropionase n=1 Tax=Anopheles sinensis TaxID=74873 RepID=A0A084W0B1_ANOSI|nr:imidazolonepropionase [Anopheles sinensis]
MCPRSYSASSSSSSLLWPPGGILCCALTPCSLFRTGPFMQQCALSSLCVCECVSTAPVLRRRSSPIAEQLWAGGEDVREIESFSGSGYQSLPFTRNEHIRDAGKPLQPSLIQAWSCDLLGERRESETARLRRAADYLFSSTPFPTAMQIPVESMWTDIDTTRPAFGAWSD